MPVNRRSAKQMKRFLNIDMDVYLDAVQHLGRAAVILWIVMLDNKEDWQFSAIELQKRANISRQSYSTALKELQTYGLVVKQLRTRKAGKFRAPVYDVYDRPIDRNHRAQKLGMVESTDTKGFVSHESHKTGILTMPSKPSPVNKPLTSTNKQSIITSNKKDSSAGNTVEHVENVPVSSSQYKPTQNKNRTVYEFAEVSLEQTKTDHPHRMTAHDEQILDKYVNSFAMNTDVKTAKRLVNLSFAQLATRSDVGYPMAYAKKIMDEMLNDQVRTVRDATDAYQLRNRTGVSLAKFLKIQDDESYDHDDTDYDDLEYLLDSASEFYDRQNQGEQVESSTDRDDSLDIDEDNLPF